MNVTATINGWEIGFGSGTSAAYAIEECIDSIESIYFEDGVIGGIELVFSDIGGSGYPKHSMLTEYYYRQREYF
jgi:hypothetical protein